MSAAFARLFRGELTAADVVMTARHAALEPWWHQYDDTDRRRAASLLADAGFAHTAERAFGVLSEGERQQVLLARTRMVPHELLVLDEPFAGLDLGARERLLAQLTLLAADGEVGAMVLVTHHLEEIPPGFTHGVLLAEGEVRAAGRLDEVLTSEHVSAAFGIDVVVDAIGDAGRKRYRAAARATLPA